MGNYYPTQKHSGDTPQTHNSANKICTTICKTSLKGKQVVHGYLPPQNKGIAENQLEKTKGSLDLKTPPLKRCHDACELFVSILKKLDPHLDKSERSSHPQVPQTKPMINLQTNGKDYLGRNQRIKLITTNANTDPPLQTKLAHPTTLNLNNPTTRPQPNM